jgi:hypothetical protein
LLKGSCFSNARIADASAMAATLSFTPGFCPALGDQLGDKVTIFRNVARYDSLRRFDRLLRGAQAQFTLPDCLDQQLISGLNAGGGAAFRRNHDAALVI